MVSEDSLGTYEVLIFANDFVSIRKPIDRSLLFIK